MKQIKCSRCEKLVYVEDSYPLKCCSICLTKLKNKRALKRDSKKLVKSMKFEFKIAKSMQNFHNYQKFNREQFNREVSFEDYIKDLQRIKEAQIYLKDDISVAQIREIVDPYEANYKAWQEIFKESMPRWRAQLKAEKEAENQREIDKFMKSHNNEQQQTDTEQ